MSSIPTDPDEDDIKDILESMWELTSGSNRDDFYNSDSSEEISNSQKNDQRQPSSHFRLIDALDGLRTPATSSEHAAPRLVHGHSSNDWGPEIGSDTDASARHQLSSLNPTADGRFVASMQMEQPMPTDSGQDPHNGQPAHFNGNGHDILNGNQQNINTLRPSESAPITAGNISPGPTMSGDKFTPDPDVAQNNTTAPSAPSTPAPTANKETGEVKRVMASFFDNKMNHMADKVATKAPAPQAAPPQAAAPAPIQAAPIQTAPNPPASAPPVQTSVPVQQVQAPTPLQPVQAPVIPQTPVQHDNHTAHDSAAELMRPVLRQWLGENMPKIVESALQIEAAQTMHPDDTKKPDK